MVSRSQHRQPETTLQKHSKVSHIRAGSHHPHLPQHGRQSSRKVQQKPLSRPDPPEQKGNQPRFLKFQMKKERKVVCPLENHQPKGSMLALFSLRLHNLGSRVLHTVNSNWSRSKGINADSELKKSHQCSVSTLQNHLSVCSNNFLRPDQGRLIYPLPSTPYASTFP